jgi:hypothetical protein
VSKAPISAHLRAQVTADAKGRCGYCQCQEGLLGAALEIDHLTPEAEGGKTERGNLWLACSTCNKRKGKRRRIPVPGTDRTVRLFNPRGDRWADHFRWVDDDELIEGKTDIGRATVAALELNLPPVRVIARRNWKLIGKHPPTD